MDLAQLRERLTAATGPDRELDATVALALGWQQRKVTSLGLNGRTPGSVRWFEPGRPFYNADGSRYIGSAQPPNFTGPRGRVRALALLQAKATTEDPSRSLEEKS